MIKHTVTITIQGQTLGLPANLDVERLDPNAMPPVITGELSFEDGSVADFQVHVNDPEKRMWFVGNHVGYYFRMESEASHRFVASQHPFVGNT